MRPFLNTAINDDDDYQTQRSTIVAPTKKGFKCTRGLFYAFITTFFMVGIAMIFKLIYIHQIKLMQETGAKQGINSFEVQFFKTSFQLIIIGALYYRFGGIDVDAQINGVDPQ